MIIRYQMGPYPDGPSWDSLDLAIRLMRVLEPEAAIHVTHQGELHREIAGVCYHPQKLPDGAPYCDGRHIPPRLAVSQHEVWLDNDHIMWSLPPGWKAFTARTNAVLVWRTDWRYYGRWDKAIPEDWNASAGMWGLPPACHMGHPVYLGETERNQDEYGWVVKFLHGWPDHEYVYESADVRLYCPGHNSLIGKTKLGIHGVHFNGLNRGWNPRGAELLQELRRLFLLDEDGSDLTLTPAVLRRLVRESWARYLT